MSCPGQCGAEAVVHPTGYSLKVTGLKRLLQKTDLAALAAEDLTCNLRGELWQLLDPLGLDLALGHHVLGLFIVVVRMGGNREGF